MHLHDCAGCLQCALLLLSSRMWRAWAALFLCACDMSRTALHITMHARRYRVCCVLPTAAEARVWRSSSLHACADLAPRTPATSLRSDYVLHTYVVPWKSFRLFRECPMFTSGPLHSCIKPGPSNSCVAGQKCDHRCHSCVLVWFSGCCWHCCAFGTTDAMRPDVGPGFPAFSSSQHSMPFDLACGGLQYLHALSHIVLGCTGLNECVLGHMHACDSH